jgi:hypothetical protein
MFLVKYDANGSVLWAKGSVGSGSDAAHSISADGNGNAYVTGSYASSPIAFGTSTLTAGNGNLFLTKYDANGNTLWAKSSGGAQNTGYSVSSNSTGAFVTGSKGQPMMILGSYTLSASGSEPSFVAKFDANGNVTFAAGLNSGGDDWMSVSVGKFCNAYIVGDFIPNTFAVGQDTLRLTGLETPFLSRLSYLCQPDALPENQALNPMPTIFPNPNAGVFKMWADEEINNGEIVLLNLLGQEVHRQKIVAGINDISARELAQVFTITFCLMIHRE